MMFRMNEKKKRILAYTIAIIMIFGTFLSLFSAIFSGYARPGIF